MIALGISIALTVGFVILIALICAAPEGWEDRDGFHVGPDPRLQSRFDSVEASADARPFFAVDPSNHAQPTATERREYPRDR